MVERRRAAERGVKVSTLGNLRPDQHAEPVGNLVIA